MYRDEKRTYFSFTYNRRAAARCTMKAKAMIAFLGLGMLLMTGCVASAGYGYGPRYYPPRPYYGYGPRTEVIVAPAYHGGYHGGYGHHRWR